MSNSLIDPVEDPQVNADSSITEPREDKPEESAPDELVTWAQAKGFDPNLDRKFLESYRNLEQDHGRLRNEVGESRQLMDRVIRLEEERREASVPAEEEFKLDPTDLLADPTSTLDNFFERRIASEREKYETRISQLESQLGQNTLQTKHQDAADLANDPDFVAYVQESPIRQRVAALAVQNNDLSALDDLLTDYKASRGSQPEEKSKQEDPGKSALEAARAAQLESSASSGSSGSDDTKIYSRNDLIRKKIEDPEGYGDPYFQEKIKLAYAEGRVR